MARMPPCPRCGGTIRAELSEIVMIDPATGKRSTYLWVNHACPDDVEQSDAAEIQE